MRPGEEKHRLKILLSIARSRAMHWLEDHPEPKSLSLWGSLLVLFGWGERPYRPDAREMMTRAWAKAWVQTADEVAKERGLELLTLNRRDLPWWEGYIYGFPFGDGKGVERQLREKFMRQNVKDVEYLQDLIPNGGESGE